MAEGIGTQVVEAPKVALNTLKRTPFLAITIAAIVLFLTLLIETYKPGVFTNPIRTALGAIGIAPKPV